MSTKLRAGYVLNNIDTAYSTATQRALAELLDVTGPALTSAEAAAHPERFAEMEILLSSWGAPLIRIWAGDKNDDDATPQEIDAVVDDTRRIAELAQAAGVTLAYEFHEGTLTQRSETALLLAERVSDVRFYWQPPHGVTVPAARASLEALLPRLGNLHVFHWVMEADSPPRRLLRQPLDMGVAAWQCYLHAAVSAPGDRWALLEFVQDDDPAQFLRDAATLLRLLSAA